MALRLYELRQQFRVMSGRLADNVSELRSADQRYVFQRAIISLCRQNNYLDKFSFSHIGRDEGNASQLYAVFRVGPGKNDLVPMTGQDMVEFIQGLTPGLRAYLAKNRNLVDRLAREFEAAARSLGAWQKYALPAGVPQGVSQKVLAI